jgi:hypothetical protein
LEIDVAARNKVEIMIAAVAAIHIQFDLLIKRKKIYLPCYRMFRNDLHGQVCYLDKGKTRIEAKWIRLTNGWTGPSFPIFT